MSVINNVVFNYVKIHKAYPKYGNEPGCAINDCEYSVDVCLPAETAKKLRKKYKVIKSVKDMSTFDAEEYKKVFKVDTPDAKVYANADGEYSVMKLKCYAGYNDGTPVPEVKKPRVVGSKTPTTDSNGLEVGRGIEVGNGSTGKVSFVERSWEYKGKTGLSLDLTGIQVEVLVPYVAKTAANVNEFEFEEGELDEFGYSEEDKGASEDSDTSEDASDDDEW